jgi:bifunctional non-homologous end joining protein LigD
VSSAKGLGAEVQSENILQLSPDAVVVPSKEELAFYWTRVWKRALPHVSITIPPFAKKQTRRDWQ